MEFVTLNNGIKMPLEGFGVFQVPDPAQCEQLSKNAVFRGKSCLLPRNFGCRMPDMKRQRRRFRLLWIIWDWITSICI